ncbi:MAG: putative membrane protein YedE/YeeE [Parasphingorhabdus sp.]
MIINNLPGALLGGVLLGLSALMVLVLNGRIAGVSGIFAGFLNLKPNDISWRGAFLAGLLLGGVALMQWMPSTMQVVTSAGTGKIILAGLLVGFGTRMGSGCTSGHGICGLGRLSPRSAIAVLTFMATGMLSASFLSSFI